MSILVFVVLLCALIVLFAVAADLAAHANRRWRAGLLNLCGLLLLALGVLALFVWSHHGRMASIQLGRPAHAGQVWPEPAMVEPAIVDQPAVVDPPVHSARDEEHPALTPEDESAERPAQHSPSPAEQPPSPAETPAEPAEQAETPAEPPVAPAEPPAEATAESPKTQVDVEDTAAHGVESDVVGDLSAAPQPQVEIDYAARPDWVDRPARDEGSVHQIAVCSGPYLRSHDAHRELQRQLKQVTNEYIDELLGQASASQWVSWDAAQIGRELVAAQNHFEEKVISPSFGVMYQSHALLEFGPAFHCRVEESWRQIQARAQLVKVGLGAAAILGTLMLLFGFFQADTVTRGFYSGRLKFVTAVAILGLIACGVYLARSIPWLWL